MTKFHAVAGISVSAACLGVAGAAVAFGGGSDVKAHGYTGNYD